jgi:hypothetical protein
VSATETPNIYQALALVMRDTMPVGKDQVNQHQRYNFRGIDDLMSSVAGPMRKHGVFIIPSVTEQRTERRGEKTVACYLTMQYRIYGPAGDYVEASVPGEASDFADKATNKAMSAALKYLLLQVLMVPIDARSIDDGDRDHPVEPTPEHRAERARNQQRRGFPQQVQRAPQGNGQRPQAVPAASNENGDRQAALEEMRSMATELNFADGLAAQFQSTFGHPIEQGTADEFREATALMRGTAAA